MEESRRAQIKNQQAMQPGHFEGLLYYFFLSAAAKCSGHIAGLDPDEHFFQSWLAEL